MNELEQREKEMLEALKHIDEQKKRLKGLFMNTVQSIEAWQDDTIKLNVGGKVFETTEGTLRRLQGTLFEEICTEAENKSLIKREDGTLFLD